MANSEMGEEPTHHRIALEFLEADTVPAEVDAGACLMLKIRVSSEMDASGAPYLITCGDDVCSHGTLPAFVEGKPNDVSIEMLAPAEAGEFNCNFTVPQFNRDETVCEQASLPFTLRARAHVTSLAVWDCPSPIVIGEKFRVKVGGRCSSSCATLRGREIEIRDAAGRIVGRAQLGATPWPDTDALYWTELELIGPERAGLHTWTAGFSPELMLLPHKKASFAFSLMVDQRPEHTVTVRIVEKQTDVPLGDTQVRLGAYRKATDKGGLVQFAVPGGKHELSVWKSGYEAPSRTLEVQSDAQIEVAAVLLPVVDPDSYWQG